MRWSDAAIIAAGSEHLPRCREVAAAAEQTSSSFPNESALLLRVIVYADSGPMSAFLLAETYNSPVTRQQPRGDLRSGLHTHGVDLTGAVR
jgi:hypothetical protein